MAKFQKPTEPLPSQGDFRVPPQDLLAEEAVLGAMMLSREAVEVVLEILEEQDFYREANRKIFRAIVTLHDKKEPVDMITVPNELKRIGEFDNIGGVST